MTDVILKIDPFSFYQSVYMKTPKQIETDKIKLSELNNFLFSLPSDAVVQIVGNKEYIERFVTKYQEEEKTKYQDRQLKIIIRGK